MPVNPYPNNDDSRMELQPCQVVSSATSVNAGLTTTFLMGKASTTTTSTTAVTTTSTTAITGSADLLGTYPLIPLPNVQTVRGVSLALASPTSKYQASVIGALSFTKVEGDPASKQITSVGYIIHGNYTAMYAGPLYAQFIGDTVLKTVTPLGSIKTNINPLPLTTNQNSVVSNYQTGLVVTFIMLAVPYVPAAFATFLVREREVRAKHQQLVSGVSIPAYWLAAWFWDNASYQLTVWLIMLLLGAFPNTENLSGAKAVGPTIGLLILFGSSVSGFTYLVSIPFTSPSSAQIFIIFLVFILGLILSIVGLVLRLIPTTTSLYLDHVRYIFAIFPPFALGEGLNNLAQIDNLSRLELGGTKKYSTLDWNMSGMALTFMAWETVIYLGAIIAYEYIIELPCTQQSASASLPGMGDEGHDLKDEDVLEEERRIKSGHGDDSSVILVKDVKKVYSTGKYAVKGVSLGIPIGECFGLLGINGAGKSSVLNMLSGAFRPTVGEAYLEGISLSTDVHACRRKIGFCPQFDALFELLTAREHLEMYARIKGIIEEDIPRVVDAKISEMGLTEYADRNAGTYSGMVLSLKIVPYKFSISFVSSSHYTLSIQAATNASCLLPLQ